MTRSIEEELALIGVLGNQPAPFASSPAVTLMEEDRDLIRRTASEIRMKMKIAEEVHAEIYSLLTALDQLVALSPRSNTSQEPADGKEVPKES